MAFTEAEARALLLVEVGDDVNNTVAANWPLLWTVAGVMAGSLTSDTEQGALLRYQFALVKACDLLLGTVREDVSFSEKDRSEKLSELTANLQKKRETALIEIKRLTALVTGAAGIEVGALTTTHILSSPAGYVDANDPYYSGASPQRYYPRVAP